MNFKNLNYLKSSQVREKTFLRALGAQIPILLMCKTDEGKRICLRVSVMKAKRKDGRLVLCLRLNDLDIGRLCRGVCKDNEIKIFIKKEEVEKIESSQESN